MEKLLQTLTELEVEAVRLARELIPSERGATLVTLSGELGAGKTTFTQALARALGVTDTVTSPTFVLEKLYQLPRELGSLTSKFARLVHVDAYRLESGADLAPLNFDELMRGSNNLIVLEWPERVADALPMPAVRISLVANPDASRTISYD